MKLGALWQLICRDLIRARGALVTSGFGIAAGTAALVFFVALGLGVSQVLLGDIFPIDQIELEPPKAEDPGLLMGLVFGGGEPPGISDDDIDKLRASPHIEAVYPKLRFAFPASAHGGKEILGRNVGTSEMVADGIDPSLVKQDVLGPYPFVDPMAKPGKKCRKTTECKAPRYCEGPAEGEGYCVEPVPVLVSRYLVELFDKSIAPAHNMPPIGETLVKQAEGIVFKMWLGESVLGKAKQGGPRHVHARVVGISPRAIDIGITLPLETVRRFNREYAGDAAAKSYSSALIKVRDKERVSDVIALGDKMELTPKDTRARDISVLLSGIIGLLSLVAGIILFVSASNIAYTFRVFVNDRRREIALYRALGATRGDMILWLIGLALTVGVVGGALGTGAAWLLSLGADRLAATQLPDFPFKPDTFFAFPPWLLVGALAFAASFALLGAIGPARRAGKVDPAAALASL